MGLLLPIITKSIMGNNESIITHYEPTQLADETPWATTTLHTLATAAALATAVAQAACGRRS